MVIARLVLRMCRFLERHGHKSKACDKVIFGPIPVYGGGECMNKKVSA